MAKPSLRAFFDLTEGTQDDFARLVERYSIDLTTDLRNCDLSNVDFGSVRASEIDLTGSILDGADLSRVKSKKIIIADSTIITATTRLPHPAKVKDENIQILKAGAYSRAALAINRFNKADWLRDQIALHSNETAAPVMAFYDSASMQDHLTRQLCDVFRPRTGLPDIYYDLVAMDTVWFYTRQMDQIGDIELDQRILDTQLFNLIESVNLDHDVVMYPSKTLGRVRRIKERVQAESSLGNKREAFARQLAEELKTANQSVIIFSGFGPISRDLYARLRERISRRFKLIFLCTASLEPQFKRDNKVWVTKAVPAHAISEPRVSAEDIHNICKRIKMASNEVVTFSDETIARLEAQFLNKSLPDLKNKLLDLVTWGFSTEGGKPVMWPMQL